MLLLFQTVLLIIKGKGEGDRIRAQAAERQRYFNRPKMPIGVKILVV